MRQFLTKLLAQGGGNSRLEHGTLPTQDQFGPRRVVDLVVATLEAYFPYCRIMFSDVDAHSNVALLTLCLQKHNSNGSESIRDHAAAVLHISETTAPAWGRIPPRLLGGWRLRKAMLDIWKPMVIIGPSFQNAVQNSTAVRQ